MVALNKKLPLLPDGNIDVAAWLEKHSFTQNEFIQRAVQFAQIKSKGLTTFYGQPCIAQSLEMAEMMLDLQLDQEAIAAAIITSTLQHTQITIDMIKEKLGENVAKLANGVREMSIVNTLLSNVQKNRDQSQIDRLRKTFLAMASDIRVVLIKLVEQMSIMRGIKKINSLERKKIAQQTFDIYAPLANRLGIGQLKWELEDLAFHYTDPEMYLSIAKYLAEKRIDRERRIHEVIVQLKKYFAENHIEADISGRAKHIYSIYLKMQKKHVNVSAIYDASAIRILVPKLEDCYKVLSIVHEFWEPIQEEFDDYIANPKANGYRSIHTAVIGPDHKNLEIQVRTKNMHLEAEHGVAAHWLYKENKAQQTGYEAKITYLRQLLSWHKELSTQTDNPPKHLTEVLEDRVYVFTPAGDIMDLPKGATPLDFAYQIHGGLGHRCRGAKINHHIVPLTYTLRTSDHVEIITVKEGTPSRDWLNKDLGYVKTSQARAKISRWFKQQETDQYIETAKHTLEREFAKANLHKVDLQKIAEHFHFKNAEALLSTLGHGSIRAAQIVTAAQHMQHHDDTTEKPATTAAVKSQLPQSGFQIAGVNDLLTRVAKCCKPIPGDAIIGFITQGRGISIHRKDCRNMSHLDEQHEKRLTQVSWDSDSVQEFYVDLQLKANGDEELLKDITSLLANAKIDLIAMNSSINKKNNILFALITVQIKHQEQLPQLINQLKQLPNVNDVRRVTE